MQPHIVLGLQSLDCLTELPRLWDVVVTIDSLISTALPPRHGPYLPSGEGRSAETAGPLQKARERPFLYLCFSRNFATSMESRTPASWLEVAGRGRQLSPTRVESPTMRLLRISMLQGPVKSTLPRFILHRTSQKLPWGSSILWSHRASNGTRPSSDHRFVWLIGLTDSSRRGWRITYPAGSCVACASPRVTEDVNNMTDAFDHRCQRTILWPMAVSMSASTTQPRLCGTFSEPHDELLHRA